MSGTTTNNTANLLFQRKIALGQDIIRPHVDTPEADAAVRETRLQMFEANTPVFTLELTEEDTETLAEMLLEGKTLNIMSQCIGLNLPQTRIAIRSAKVQARVDELAAEMIKGQSLRIKNNAAMAVTKLIKMLESDSDKISLAASKELIRLAGIGQDEKEKEQAKTNDMQAKSTERLLDILQGAMGGRIG